MSDNMRLKKNYLQNRTKDPDRLLMGPKTPYKPQTEKTSLKPVIEPMNVTKALTSLGMVTGRGMDNGQAVSFTILTKTSLVRLNSGSPAPCESSFCSDS